MACKLLAIVMVTKDMLSLLCKLGFLAEDVFVFVVRP